MNPVIVSLCRCILYLLGHKYIVRPDIEKDIEILKQFIREQRDAN